MVETNWIIDWQLELNDHSKKKKTKKKKVELVAEMVGEIIFFRRENKNGNNISLTGKKKRNATIEKLKYLII